MIHDVQAIAAEVIRKTSKDKPADQALREVLKPIKDLAPFDSAEIAKTVFRYYRWHFWLRDERGVEAKMRLALRLQNRFLAQVSNIPIAEIREKAVPAWTAEQVAITDEWLLTLQTEPRLWLRAKADCADHLARQLVLVDEHPRFPTAMSYRGNEDLFRTKEFQAGEFEIQDIASQAVGWICAPQPGETWWDTCAGEGGKTLHLSDLMKNKGLIWASDRAEWRLKQLKRRAARAQAFNFRVAPWDGSHRLPTKTKFDGVLVDAPCSGVGTWQRNPHARWTTLLQDVTELAAIQKNLLANVAGSVKPGGKLVFAVCTLTRAETTEVAADFTSKFGGEFEPLVEKEFNGLQFIWPQDLGGNGMFIAAWRRKRM